MRATRWILPTAIVALSQILFPADAQAFCETIRNLPHTTLAKPPFLYLNGTGTGKIFNTDRREIGTFRYADGKIQLYSFNLHVATLEVEDTDSGKSGVITDCDGMRLAEFEETLRADQDGRTWSTLRVSGRTHFGAREWTVLLSTDGSDWNGTWHLKAASGATAIRLAKRPLTLNTWQLTNHPESKTIDTRIRLMLLAYKIQMDRHRKAIETRAAQDRIEPQPIPDTGN